MVSNTYNEIKKCYVAYFDLLGYKEYLKQMQDYRGICIGYRCSFYNISTSILGKEAYLREVGKYGLQESWS